MGRCDADLSRGQFQRRRYGAGDPRRPEWRRALYYQAQKIASSQYLQLTTYPQSTRLGIYKTTQGVRLEPSLAVTYLYDAWVNK